MNIKLFCLSHAGGTAMTYTKWKTFLHNRIDVYPLEMPGRGTRFSCPLCGTIENVIDDLFYSISREINNSEYVFFGHSMGTLIIYELMRKITHMGYKHPLHIFFSGRFPPHIKEGKNIHLLSDEFFKEEIIKLGGMPKELLDNEEIFGIFLPILRADYKIVEEYKYIDASPWDFGISVLYGKEDQEVQEYNYSEWKRYTSKECHYYEFGGDHFYINDNTENIVRVINEVLVEK